jgi:molecular chaperone HtpG
MDGETFAFNADIAQLMGLIINTFYSNKEIFLRELLSNASDALDKARYASLTDQSHQGFNQDLTIEIESDVPNNTLTIRDTGIGMTKQELIDNLGTIARSGTKAFMESISSGTDMSMIGQFGVGFYSAYLVAERVEVYSKRLEQPGHVWVSEAGASFTIREASVTEDAAVHCGTSIKLFLKADQQTYAETNTLRTVVKKHSEFIEFPIRLRIEKGPPAADPTEPAADPTEPAADPTEPAADPTEPAADHGNEEKTLPTIEDVDDTEDEDDDAEDAVGVSEVGTSEWELLNTQKPLWCRKPEEVSAAEYALFYQSIDKAHGKHCAVKHFSVEGQLEFKAILYVPETAPFDLFASDAKKQNEIRLYVRRVFIMDDCKELMPNYLSFVKGVVDSEDLPLNVSRETLQQTNVLRVIRKSLVRKSLEMFAELAEQKDEYQKFYKAFGKNLRLGVHEDVANRKKLMELLRYDSNQAEFTSLKDYVSRMSDTQKSIFYITGETKEIAQNSPFLERLQAQGLEVLYMTEAIDEYVVQQLQEYGGFKMVCATKEGLEFDQTAEEKSASDLEQTQFESLCTLVKAILGDKIEKVVLSSRIVSSPCILVTGEFGWSANMERIMNAQALHDQSMSTYMTSKKTMELNPKHYIIRELQRRSLDNKDEPAIREAVQMLFDTALLTSGFSLEEPASFAKRIHGLVALGLDIHEQPQCEHETKVSHPDGEAQPTTGTE